jgi:hypothetical protein
MKKLTAVFGVIFVMAAALVGPGLAEKNPAAATGLIVAGVLVVIGLALLAGVVIGGLWTRRAMADGAAIALKAQEVNDTWDAKKTAAFAGLMREGASIGRQAPGALPALPMGQGEVFSLPPLAEFGGRHFEVIDQDDAEQ